MSIWASTTHVGTEPATFDTPMRGGHVLTYAKGFSNHHPNLDGTHELPASIHLAEQVVHGDGAGPWLRLGITADRSLNFWTGQPTTESVRAMVVMDEAAVRQHITDLQAWLTRRDEAS